MNNPEFDPAKCIICQSPKSQIISPPNYDGKSYQCDYCGNYSISGSSLAILTAHETLRQELLAKGSSIAFERKLRNLDGYQLNVTGTQILIGDIDFLQLFPQDAEDRIHRSLLNIYYSVNKEPKRKITISQYDTRIFFPINGENKALITEHNKRYLDTLVAFRYILFEKNHKANTVWDITLTIKGWEEAKELEQKKENVQTAFIAMWFDEQTQQYRKATKEAVERAGYDPIIVDEHPHNDYIMDKILNLIKDARFVIADFTSIEEQVEHDKIRGGVRGGVYYEAGYAKGLGIPLIATCKNDPAATKRIHFDIQQLNTLYWQEKDGNIVTGNNHNDYIESLKERIIATIGKGKKILMR